MTTNSLHSVTGSWGLVSGLALWLSQRRVPEQNLVGIPPLEPGSVPSLLCPASSGFLICKDPTTFITSSSRHQQLITDTSSSQQPFQSDLFIIRPFPAKSRLQLKAAVAKKTLSLAAAWAPGIETRLWVKMYVLNNTHGLSLSTHHNNQTT